MELTKIIQSALKSKKVIIGYKKSMNYLKINSPKMVIIAENIPKQMKEKIEHNVKTCGVDLKVFNGSSKDLGLICGKSFPISTLTIKK